MNDKPIETIRLYNADGETVLEVSTADESGQVSGIEFRNSNQETAVMEVCLDDSTQLPISFLLRSGDVIAWEPGWEDEFTLRVPDYGNEEINVMAMMHEALHRLDEENRSRALAWVTDRLASEAT